MGSGMEDMALVLAQETWLYLIIKRLQNMLFNSFEFLLFFPVVAIGYYLIGGVIG